MTVAAVATVLSALAAAPAQAQAPRNGPEWGGKDHQPTQAEVTRSEDRAGVQPSQAENQADTRSVEQLDKQLLNKEGINSSSVPAPSAPR